MRKTSTGVCVRRKPRKLCEYLGSVLGKGLLDLLCRKPDMSLYPQSVSIFAASSKLGASIMRSALSRVSIFASLALSIAERSQIFFL